MSDTRTGHCLCGTVSFTAEVTGEMTACHCSQCQRWTGGGPYLSARARNVFVSGGETARVYHASDWAERVSCATCGSILWWKMQGKPVAFVAVGLLDDQSGLKVTEEVFADYRPEWLPPFEGATQSTEAEEMVKLEAYLAEQGE